MTASYPAFHVGEVGVAYTAVTPSATGGVQPYKWTVSAGSLPPGVNLGNDGSVAGTPTAAGTYAFTIQVADAGNSTVPISGRIGIAAALSASLIPACAQYCNVELGCVSACGGFGTLSGGVAPYNYGLISGQLPAGTSLNALSLAGTFVGLSGYLKFTVQVTDALGATASISPTFWMWNHISWSGTYKCYGTYATSCSVQITYTGGVPGGQALVTLGTIGSFCPFPTNCPTAPPANAPPNMTATATPIGANGGGTVTVFVPANCSGGCRNGYVGAIGLVVIDQALCGANSRCQTGEATVDVYMQTG